MIIPRSKPHISLRNGQWGVEYTWAVTPYNLVAAANLFCLERNRARRRGK